MNFLRKLFTRKREPFVIDYRDKQGIHRMVG